MGPRVLHYAPSLHLAGGIRQYVLNLSAEQMAHGLDVDVAGPGSQSGDSHTVASLSQAIERYRPQVVHLHGREVFDQSEWPRLPVVTTTHGHELYCPSGRKWSPSLGVCGITPSATACTATMLRHQCGSRRPTKIVSNLTAFSRLREQQQVAHQHCVSQFLADRMAESGYQPVGGASVIYAAVPRAEPVADSPVYDVMFAGRLQPNKGVDVLLRASASCASQPRIAVVGDGTQLSALKSLADDLGISGRTDFLGWRPQRELIEMHSTRTLLAVPSQWPDPAPMVAMEAAARGRVCLVSNRGGLPELVPMRDQVAADQDPLTWSAAIDTALTTTGWFDAHARAARGLWEQQFDPDVVVPAFTSLYESVLA